MNLMHIDIVTVNPCTISCGNWMKLRKSKKLSFTTGKEGPMGQASWLRLPWLHWELPANIPGSTLVKTWHWWHHENQWDALLQTVPAHRTAICQPPDRATTCIGDSVWPKSSGPTGGCHHQKSPEITDLRCKHMFRAFRVTKTPFRKYHQSHVSRPKSFFPPRAVSMPSLQPASVPQISRSAPYRFLAERLSLGDGDAPCFHRKLISRCYKVLNCLA